MEETETKTETSTTTKTENQIEINETSKIENKIKKINVISSKVDKQIFFWCCRQNSRWRNTKKLFTKFKNFNSHWKSK